MRDIGRILIDLFVFGWWLLGQKQFSFNKHLHKHDGCRQRENLYPQEDTQINKPFYRGGGGGEDNLLFS